MSEVKLISPLLDGFSVGNTMSEHNGVRCCPAIKENTDKKYILKVVSIPATQAQMDALLLAGAYKDPAGAMEYFHQVGEDILKEAELLKTLSKLDGFLPYEGWQMEPITRRRLGYEVYLIGSYKRSLEKHLKSHPVTHLEAVNLGLDLCAALSICRDSGSIYVALKPSNVFVSDKKEYRIGDLGFIPLDALKYTTLPEKYYSPYTPYELFDPMAPMNLTVDTYAVGMILYQLYNDCLLPFKGTQPPEGAFPSPVNADYEIAEIIMKAIDPDPAKRWDDPKEMGKALAAYMQRNTINDIPITPHTPLDVIPEDIISDSDGRHAEDTALPEESPADILLDPQHPHQDLSQDSNTVQVNYEAPEEEINVSEEALDETEEPQATSVSDGDQQPAGTAEEISASTPENLSAELSEIISKADDLIAHEPLEGVVITVVPEEQDPFGFAKEEDEGDDIEPVQFSSDDDSETESTEPQIIEPRKEKKKRKRKHFADPKYHRRAMRLAISLIWILIFTILGMLGYLYYQNIYLQKIISLSTDGTQDQITVSVKTKADHSLLLIKCVDPYGNTDTQSLSDGKAIFTGLNPSTMYNIQVEINGFHKLTGDTSDVFTTDSNTKVTNFNSVAGSKDGSVVLNFTVDGEEPRSWSVYYTADGEQEKRCTFTGHSVTIEDLTIGKLYTFRLDPGENIVLSGETTLEVVASRLILAEELSVSSHDNSEITISWKTPGDVIVDNWNVRLYNDLGYDEAITAGENTATFSNIDLSTNYTVEVTAAGMTQSARTAITAHPLSITNVTVDSSSHKKLKLTWDFTGEMPEGGWVINYRISGGEPKNLTAKKASVEIPKNIPGAKYEFAIQAASNTTVFNGLHSYIVPDAEPFQEYNLSADQLTVSLLKTPVEEPWYCESISDDLLTDTFTSNDSVSLALRSADAFYLPGTKVNIMYVFEDTYGNILPDFVIETSVSWKQIWNGGDVKCGELALPSIPQIPGEYVLNLYFDGMLAAQLPFIISE